jgi:large subunit ribosomal protein L28
MKICEISGRRFQSGNNVSHAVNKTRRRFEANIQKKRLYSELLGNCLLRITPRGLKIVEAIGGLDSFLASNKPIFGNGITLRRRFFAKRNNC